MTTKDIFKIPFSAKAFEKTAKNTILKYNYTINDLMYRRSPIELLDNIFMGDIAKNLLLDYLRKKCSSEIIDYDEIRKDNFTLSDPGWDLMFSEKKYKIEIKSSIPPNNENHESIIKNRDIKITASNDNGKSYIDPKRLESHIHVQIYFYAKNFKKGFENHNQLKLFLKQNPESIHKILNTNKYKNCLFFGWWSKKSIVKFLLNNNNPTWGFNKSKRIYWKCPIKFAKNIKDLIYVIENN